MSLVFTRRCSGGNTSPELPIRSCNFTLDSRVAPGVINLPGVEMKNGNLALVYILNIGWIIDINILINHNIYLIENDKNNRDTGQQMVPVSFVLT